MNSDQAHKRTDNPNDPVQSASRRRLLRAAATAAPLVATLPSGAAWAQASTAQCIVATQPGRDQDPALQNLYEVPAPDGYLRVLAYRTGWTKGFGQPTIETIHFEQGQGPYYLPPPDPTQPADTFDPEGYAHSSPVDQPTWVLRWYVPEPDPDAPETVRHCNEQDPSVCVWPITSTSVNNQQAMLNTCMCSVNPSLGVDCGP